MGLKNFHVAPVKSIVMCKKLAHNGLFKVLLLVASCFDCKKRNLYTTRMIRVVVVNSEIRTSYAIVSRSLTNSSSIDPSRENKKKRIFHRDHQTKSRQKNFNFSV